MRCTISHARADLSALVSIAEAKRIWHLQDDDEIEWKHPLSGIRGMWSRGRNIPGMEPGPDGSYVTAREAALKVRVIQMTRAEERRILARGGLDPVAGGELAARPVSSLWRRLFRF